jgi:Mg2+/Co2+ transporter CorB
MMDYLTMNVIIVRIIVCAIVLSPVLSPAETTVVSLAHKGRKVKPAQQGRKARREFKVQLAKQDLRDQQD